MIAEHDDNVGALAWRPSAEQEYEYAVGEHVEVTDGEDWFPVRIAGRFIGPVSGRPVYKLAFTTGHMDATYGDDLRPVSA